MRRLALLILLCCGAAATAAPREDAFLLLDHQVGNQRVTTRSGGKVEVHFAYRDRDHGEDLVAEWTLDAAGIPLRYAVSGHDYLQAPVREQFRRDGRGAQWQNLHARGGSDSGTAAFYLPETAPPEYFAALVHALLKAPDGRLPLLPDGEARLQRVGSVVDGDAAAATEFVHYRISGLGFSPQWIWLAADGTPMQVSTWSSVLPADRKALRTRLLQAQDEADLAWQAELAQRLGRRPSGDVLIRGARLFDARDGRVHPGSSVLIRGERVLRVAPGAAIDAAGAEVVDARGRFLMPGLWDNHQHFDGVDGLLDIACGVTTGRDLANDDDGFLRRAARFDAGSEIGPRIVRAGMIDGSGPYAGPTPKHVDTLEQALAAVDWYADRGYSRIKSYMSLKPEFIAPMAARAHERGLRFSGHVPAFMSAEQFVEAGADELHHFNYVVLDLLWPQVQETTKQSQRFGQVAAHAHEFDPQQPRVAALIEFLRKRQVAIDPTLALLEARIAGDASRITPALAAVADRFPVGVRRGLRGTPYAPPHGEEEAYAAALPAMLKLLHALHAAGVTIVPGTDMLAGYSLHHELALYVRAGIAPADVLRMATVDSARNSGLSHERGLIANGLQADLILVDGDPTRDIADIRRIDLVFSRGRIYEPVKIEAELGVKSREWGIGNGESLEAKSTAR
ncbi:amidohydrolase family protein [Tahibacter sp. UC22_41]|uniref:amidohydrolase family protein n=1 Tax=Tahibacter sp. UC22_41 TaxID=3350178 RepID=UPI0036DB2876